MNQLEVSLELGALAVLVVVWVRQKMKPQPTQVYFFLCALWL